MLARSRCINVMMNRASQISRHLSSINHPNQVTSGRMAYSGTQHKLNTGAEIPALGFGTWQDKEAQEPAVLTALKVGYRHIDTARIYGTEPAVGNAIKKSGV